ncbi:MAG: hypothetical protein WCG27_06395 [Pseudomonadota bacterium]
MNALNLKKGAIGVLCGILLTFSLSTFAQTPTFDVQIKYLNFTDAQEIKADKAKELIRRVANSEEFKQRVLNFTWQGKKQFANNDGKTNEQIYQNFMAGNETLSPQIDYTMNLEVTLYKPSYFGRNVIGYTYSNVVGIWSNRNFFNAYTPAQIAGNYTHEWCHKLGYIHDFNSTARRPYSVPYALGYLVDELATKIMKQYPQEFGN